MRHAWIRLGLFAIVCGCSRTPEGQVVELVDQIKLHGARMLPGPKRYEQLYGEPRESPLKRPPEIEKLRSLGQVALTKLAELLGDRERQRAAAFALAHIGGDEAARALHREFKYLLPDVETDHIYHVRDEGETVIAGGRRTQAPKGGADFFGELTHALSIAGGPVVPDLIELMERALADASKLPSEAHDAKRVQDGKLIAYRYRKSIQDARVLLNILCMLGDERAVPVVITALKSPVEAIRERTLRDCNWLASKKLLPHLAPFLEDESAWGDTRVKDVALESVAFIMHRRTFHRGQHSKADLDRIAAVYVKRIAELKETD